VKQHQNLTAGKPSESRSAPDGSAPLSSSS